MTERPERRPDPDELLARVNQEEREGARGKLTIFFGAAPGVGKTYTMLEAARIEVSDQERDVVVGIVETHGRYDTGAVLIGLEVLPRRSAVHRGIEVQEFDLDAALARKPELILVDELAHTNAPGSRHLKRWQDVDELLDAGIDVFTTLNVQHLESLNDVVAQVTTVVVRETVPDAVFDKAYEVRVVDLPVDQLLGRLQEGKVYVPEQAARAAVNFFKEGNLIALRELALRRTAERVEAKMRGYKAAHGIEETWHTGERVLVCVSPSPHSITLVRAARRMATSLHAELVGVYVETPASIRTNAEARERLASTMRLVESLGGEPVTLRGEDAAAETVRYARKRNVTKIVVGKPTHPRWRDLIRPSFLDDLVRQSHEIDVYVISALSGTKPSPALSAAASPFQPREASNYAASTAVTVTAALVSWFAFGRAQLADVVMVFLLGVVIVSMRFGFGASIFAAVLSVLALDFVFVPPYLSFAVSDFKHLVTFSVMFLVAVVISHLTKRIRDQADAARDRERRTASLYAVSRELGLTDSREALIDVAARHVREIFGAKVVIFTRGTAGLEVALADPGTMSHDEKEIGVADWAWVHQRPAGAGTDTLPLSRGLFVPLKGSRGRAGVLALFGAERSHLDDPDERQLLYTIGGLIGSAIERTDLAEEARRARVRVETEQLRNALLSSVSHDLRTPLGVVTGATSALLDKDAPQDESSRRELLQTAHEEALRLSRLVSNLLDMTRLEAGALRVHKEAQPIEEVVGAALNRLEDRLRGRDVRTDIDPRLPLVPLDPVFVEQVLINLLENATKYTPPDSPLEIRATAQPGKSANANADTNTDTNANADKTSDRGPGEMLIEVNDRGPGVPPEEAARVFDKFYRGRESEGGGVGLGLTICKGIIAAHGGRIWVEPRTGGGASFRFTLPLETPLETDAAEPKVAMVDATP